MIKKQRGGKRDGGTRPDKVIDAGQPINGFILHTILYNPEVLRIVLCIAGRSAFGFVWARGDGAV
jgi:hypothetical protein